MSLENTAISGKKELKRVFSVHYRTLVLYANRFLHSLEASEDVVQNSLIKLWSQDKTFNNQQALKAYLYTMVRNACLNVLKQEQLKEKYQQDIVLQDQGEEVKETAFEEVQKLYAAIQKLPERRKEVVLHHLKQYTNTEIANRLSIELQTVKNLKRLAYADIKTYLKG